ncbi:organic cation transporter protein-like isoform X3 [Tubulanus polymorphus]|uniref:organic cation transporter protein-like isoform X3 n=1 Tax=Tubulanus polymorphus TaxID=672921 RepID=UPI003DA206D3
MDDAIERTYDQLLKGSKKWHILTYLCWVIPANIVLALFSMSVVFTAGVPDYHCTVSDNTSLPRKKNGEPETCLIYSNLTSVNTTEKCSHWTYPDKEYGVTIVSEACLMIAIVAAVELFPKNLRTFAGQIMFVWWSIGLMLLDLMAYFIRNWRHLQLAVAIMPVITIIDIWLIPESVPWLLSKGKVEQAEEIVKKAAAFNGTLLPEHPFEEQAEVEEEKELGRMTLFREPILRRITFILFALWFVNNLVYYGLSLSAAELAGDRFLNFFLMALVEIPATICCMFVLESRAGRRISLSSFHILAGISLILLVCVPPVTGSGTNLMPLAVFLTLVGKFSIAASFNIVVQYSLELYPTLIRNTGSGTSSFTAPVAGTLAPFAAYLARVVPWAPGVIFGVMSLFVGILALLLPETRGRSLPHTVEDMKQWHLPSLTCGSSNRRKKIKSVNVHSNGEKGQATTLL